MKLTENNPVTPPPELLKHWCAIAGDLDFGALAKMIYSSGADRELEACLEWLDQNCGRWEIPMALREARRPKPLSLKQQALTILEDTDLPAARYNILLRALEALPDD